MKGLYFQDTAEIDWFPLCLIQYFIMTHKTLTSNARCYHSLEMCGIISRYFHVWLYSGVLLARVFDGSIDSRNSVVHEYLSPESDSFTNKVNVDVTLLLNIVRFSTPDVRMAGSSFRLHLITGAQLPRNSTTQINTMPL